MDTTIDDGGPAFPSEAFASQHNPGMTIRDWFAAHASEEDIKTYRQKGQDNYGYSYFKETREAARYRYADAMIKARQKKNS